MKDVDKLDKAVQAFLSANGLGRRQDITSTLVNMTTYLAKPPKVELPFENARLPQLSKSQRKLFVGDTYEAVGPAFLCVKGPTRYFLFDRRTFYVNPKNIIHPGYEGWETVVPSSIAGYMYDKMHRAEGEVCCLSDLLIPRTVRAKNQIKLMGFGPKGVEFGSKPTPNLTWVPTEDLALARAIFTTAHLEYSTPNSLSLRPRGVMLYDNFFCLFIGAVGKEAR